MDLHLTLSGRRDLSGQVYRQLRAAVLDGRLRPGDALPPSRELAERLGLSRNTISTAYARLGAEGFLAGRVGAGTFVSGSAAAGQGLRSAPEGRGLTPRAVWREVPELWHRPGDVPAYDFRVGLPDAGLFPDTTWRRLMARELRPSRLRAALYGNPSGEVRLREAIARHLGLSRSVQAGADDVLVTSGAQQAVDLIGRVLLEPGDCVAVEDPGYPMVRLLFQSQGARVVPVPVDAEGLVVDALPDAARLVYVTPSHQFPLGMAMSLERRMRLLAWARRRNRVIVEDDYDSEFRFDGRPLEPLQCLDRSGLVVYVGSFSKVLLPGLRLGYLVAPASLRPALRAARMVTDWHNPIASQAALARFIEDGSYVRHLRKARREYRARRQRLERALARELPGHVESIPGAAGLHLAVWFRGAENRRGRGRAAGARRRGDCAAVEPLRHGALPPVRPGAGLRRDPGVQDRRRRATAGGQRARRRIGIWSVPAPLLQALFEVAA